MLGLLDAKTLSALPTVGLPGDPHISSGCQGCNRSSLSLEVFRPHPQLDGNLVVDPEIHLPSPGIDVDIAYYYNAGSGYNSVYGYGRTLSHNLLINDNYN
jgi:hypothetical protein